MIEPHTYTDNLPVSGGLHALRRLAVRALSYMAFCSVVLVSGLTSCVAQGQTAAPPEIADGPARADQVARIIKGIVSFTRWPASYSVRRLCVVTPALYAGSLSRFTAENTGRPVVTRHYAIADTRLETDCDVLYIEVTGAAAQQLFRRLAGLPVLSVGGDDEACAQGSLFCLTRVSGAVSFAANLDGIARSGLRIDPDVLLLARREDRR
jgi:hypothetical protein